MRRFIEIATAEIAYEGFKSDSPDEFKAWKSKVIANGPPKNLDSAAEVRWGIYLERLGLSDKYKLGRDRGARGYS